MNQYKCMIPLIRIDLRDRYMQTKTDPEER